MGFQNLQNQNMNLVLSTDPKPRLKWTPELHHRFVEALRQLGGEDKATPKSLMRVMGVPRLTLYHLKSHLQKYRLAKRHPTELQSEFQSQSQSQSQGSIENKKDYKEIQISNPALRGGISEGNQSPLNESFQIAQVLQMQMEVQRKIHEQIEVQRHLQVRIEAQGKYLQSVLKKAQETLSGYSSSSLGIELAKAELSRLVSMVNNECRSPSISELTEIEGSSLKGTERKKMRGTVCSMESSLTSSESSGRKEDKQLTNEFGNTHKSNPASIELPLMDIHPREKPWNSGTSDQVKKRTCCTISDGICVEQPPVKRSKIGDRLRIFDLNSHCQNEFESGSKTIDLNCKGIEQVNGQL
ncbi:myb family transcription factor PHL8 isoform X3 [Manihot esculenta]|uniref:HTH myb-type domain-containing protein n=2 Tax=Manihot esculenta TaxID=3983 RepID=A0A2C9WHV5_MANES|nr:myb family transcription factor PHL8 isoform X3 [Manihot esculenta]KAG8661752.1 hypothetical protein MANES_01G035100v8 [Manihot esculenta]OAY59479.1 hypothetical protein MANES_01G035100v8 [Manihot esculenta]